MTLNDAKVKHTLPPEKGYSLLWDDHKDAPKGFGLRITSNGVRAFILRYKSAGRDRRLTIGKYPTWSLAAARKKAGEYKREIDGGKDILEERRLERGKLTVKQAVERFCTEHFDKLPSGPASRSRLERFVVADIGTRKLHQIRRPEIRALVRDVSQKHGRQAALLLTNLKSLFAWAEDEELIDANPVATLKPASIGSSLKPVQRTRVLDDEEVRAFWGSVESCGIRKLTALALKLVLVTGARSGEVGGMRWSEIQGKTWVIPGSRRGKTGTEHAVPLTDTALALIENARAEAKRLAKRRSKPDGGFVFPITAGSPLKSDAMAKAVGRHSEALGSKEHPDWGPWTPHDLRRTMRTGLSAERVPVLVAELAIGHVKKGIIGTYDAHHYSKELREALEVWERRLLRTVLGKPGDVENVTPIHREKQA